MAVAKSYFEILTAAINDVAIHGYDNEERIAYWTDQIRRAAEAHMKSDAEIDRMVRDAMGSIFRKQVDQGAILNLNPGVKPYTLAQMRPHLHAELGRRMSASINLIKLNRAESIRKTEQRFVGWATSIPAGGSDTVERRVEKTHLRKALAQEPFAVRRVIIDQNHKLFNSINDTVAIDGGAIGGIWQSHAHQAGYDGRPAHNARDDKFFVRKGSWADKAGYMKPGPNGYTDSVEQPGQLPFCFPADTHVNFADGVEVGYRHWFSGDLTEIVTDSGKTLRATPNHPILTTNGWIGAGALKEGDYVIEIANEAIHMPKADVDAASPLIAEIFTALTVVGDSTLETGTEEQFHGDGSKGDVDIVYAGGELLFHIDPLALQGVKKFNLAITLQRGSAAGALKLFAQGCGRAGARFMSSIRKSASAVLTFAIHPDLASIAGISNTSSYSQYPLSDRRSGNAEAPGKRKNAFARIMQLAQFDIARLDFFGLSGRSRPEVKFAGSAAIPKNRYIDIETVGDLRESLPFATKATRVVKVNKQFFSGHVYNLQTRDGWYVTEGIVSHNCRCHWQWVYSLRSVPTDCITEKGKDALTDARRKAQAA